MKEQDVIPELPAPEQKEIPGLPDAARVCPDCGREARIVTNQYGTQAFCGPCRKDWPIANPGVYSNVAVLPPRGIHKVTIVDYTTPTADIWRNS